MTSLKEQLIRLGEQYPDLREDIRPVLDEIVVRRRTAVDHDADVAALRELQYYKEKLSVALHGYHSSEAARPAVKDRYAQKIRDNADEMIGILQDVKRNH